MALDNKDSLILSELQKDSDRTDREVADTLNISPAAFGARKRRLKVDGYIKKIHAVLSPDKFELNTTGFVLIKFIHNSKEADNRFVDIVKNQPNVQEVHSVLGVYDAIIKLRAKNNQDLLEIVESISGSTEVSTATLVVARSPIETTDITI